ncbi:MAG: aspartate ammonia-lyase [Candidatus Omnitrophota bacterium]|jgi:aspartate ammonia-lyase
MRYRKETDILGEKQVPEDAYWGIHTQRALENFTISGQKVNRGLISAFIKVKKAAAMANEELGYLDPAKARAIISACDEISEGLKEMPYIAEFPVDALQGGAGTSVNMNVNEVVANRAIEIMSGKKGDYSVIDPIEDVNMHQSTNDTYPTALKAACIYGFRSLSAAIESVQGAFQAKESEFAGIAKIGRTELQEAVPITLGAEFSAFAEAFGRDRWRTFKCEERLRSVNIGGTAVGTGLTAPRDYIFLVIEKLREVTGLGLSRGENLLDATANQDAFVEVSGILKAHASNLIKISGDLRMINLLGEVILPKVQAGSSVMPGKSNPVILEAAAQAGMKVIANDLSVTQAAYKASMQIDEFMPLIAHAMLESIDIMTNTDLLLAPHIAGIKADAAKCRGYLDNSPAIITAFLPSVGYKKAEEIIKGYNPSGGKSVREYLEEKLGKEAVENALSPRNLMSLGYSNDKDA